ncbi:MAG: hypothetical protein K2F82_04685 [Muribaculaceae bacterium]|nr:hypothetical protein [Muribaculaceae bacterium]
MRLELTGQGPGKAKMQSYEELLDKSNDKIMRGIAFLIEKHYLCHANNIGWP